eukprot:Selendium_serpulae@DN6252_c0_g4_i1.p1
MKMNCSTLIVFSCLCSILLPFTFVKCDVPGSDTANRRLSEPSNDKIDQQFEQQDDKTGNDIEAIMDGKSPEASIWKGLIKKLDILNLSGTGNAVPDAGAYQSLPPVPPVYQANQATQYGGIAPGSQPVSTFPNHQGLVSSAPASYPVGGASNLFNNQHNQKSYTRRGQHIRLNSHVPPAPSHINGGQNQVVSTYAQPIAWNQPQSGLPNYQSTGVRQGQSDVLYSQLPDANQVVPDTLASQPHDSNKLQHKPLLNNDPNRLYSGGVYDSNFANTQSQAQVLPEIPQDQVSLSRVRKANRDSSASQQQPAFGNYRAYTTQAAYVKQDSGTNVFYELPMYSALI